MQEGYSILKAFVVAFYYGFHYPLQQFFDIRILLIGAAAFLPLRLAARRIKAGYRHPLAVGLLSYLAASLSFLTPLCRYGQIPEGAWLNGLYLWFVCLVLFNEWYLLGYVFRLVLQPENGAGGTEERSAAAGSRPAAARVSFRLSVKWTGRVLWLVYLAGLVPILLYARYLFPQADDFIYGADARLAWEQTHSLWAVLKAAWSVVTSMYLYWQGTYSSIFAMSLQPGIFGEQFYALTPVLLIGMLNLGMLSFLHVLCRRLKMERQEIAVVSALMLLLSVQCVISKPSAFFWFNGAVHYMFAYGFCLLFAGCMLALTEGGEQTGGRSGGRRRTLLLLLACFSGLWAGGGNLVSALLTAVCLVSFLALPAFVSVFRDSSGRAAPGGLHGVVPAVKDRLYGVVPAVKDRLHGGLLALKDRLRRLWLPSLCFAAGFLVNIAAPGNQAREAFTGGAAGVPETVAGSFYHCLRLVAGEWFSWTEMAFLLALLPFLWRAVQRTQCRFRLPGLVTGYSCCVLSSMFAPSLFAMQTVEAGRYQNLIYLTFLLLLFGNAYYWLGWLWRKKCAAVPEAGVCGPDGIAAGRTAEKPASDGGKAGAPREKDSGRLGTGASRYLAVVAAMSLLAGVMTAGTEPRTFTAVAAAASLASGEAQTYAEQMQENFDRLKAEGRETVLEPVTARPYLTFSSEIDVWYAGARSYFEKETITMEGE